MSGHLVRLFVRSDAGGSSPTPAPLTRDGAKSAAQLELSKHGYHQHDQSLTQHGLSWLVHKVGQLLWAAERHAPGKGIGLLVIVVLVALVIVAISVRVRSMQRIAKTPPPILDTETSSPAGHRKRAEEFADRGEWAQAVREWLRAITRELEDRAVLDPRPGRTAAELCLEAGAKLPAIAQDLRRATTTFDAIWYGGRPATAVDDQLLRALDHRLAGSHRALMTAQAVAP